jgi:ABC-type branched-subunit amino acid transport system ATPase component
MSIVVDRVNVRFGGVAALTDASVVLDGGRVVSVIGPNGAGKSTLFNAITGLVAISGGSVRIDGVDVADSPPHLRIARGVARTFQTPRFDPLVTVEEAVLCGFYPVSRTSLVGALLHSPAVAKEERTYLAACDRILEHFKLDAVRNATLGELPMGQVRLVEVARAIANQPKYLLLDEPAAGLTKPEQSMLISEVRRLAETGVGILLVEHNFGLVRELSNHVVVLDRGAMLVEGGPDALMQDPRFVEAYLGASHRDHAEEAAR